MKSRLLGLILISVLFVCLIFELSLASSPKEFGALVFIVLQAGEEIPIPDVSWLFTLAARQYFIILTIAVFAGCTIGVAMRHIESGNLLPEKKDIWYYVLGFGLGVWFALSRIDPVTTFTAVTGLKTLLATGQTAYAKKYSTKATNGTTPTPATTMPATATPATVTPPRHG